jgi:tetratricopeptide (TPR) repeat protein
MFALSADEPTRSKVPILGRLPDVTGEVRDLPDALGVIFCEMLSEKHTYERSMPGNQPRGRKPLRVHPKWDKILKRCLEEDPARRYGGVEEIEEALAPHLRPWLWTAASALALAAVSGTVIYLRMAIPPQTVRLAVPPLLADTATASPAARLLYDTTKQIARIKSNSQTKFTAVPLNKATYTLRGMLSGRQNGKIILQAHLTNERTHRNSRDWQFEYEPGDLRFAPVALSGIVTEEFRLPPLAVNPMVNPSARKDYWDGMYYLRRNSTLDKALTSMTQAVAEDPASPLTHAGLSEAQWYKYRVDKDRLWLDRARESLRDAEARNPGLAAIHRIEGCLAYEVGSYDRAIAEYRRAIELDPGDGSAHMWLGATHMVNNHLDEALTELQRAIELDPNSVRTYQALGAFYFRQSKFEEGIEYHKKALDLAPDEPVLRLNLITSYINLGRFADAESELRYSVGLQETIRTLTDLGMTLMYEGKDREAIRFLDRAWALDSPPGNTKRYASLMYLGIAYRRLNNRAAARDVNRRGRAMAEADVGNARDGLPLSFVAYFDAALGDHHHAKLEIRQALGLSDTSPVRWNAILTYELLNLRDDTIVLLSTSPAGQLADVNRWPDLADLQHYPRFLQLLATHPVR